MTEAPLDNGLDEETPDPTDTQGPAFDEIERETQDNDELDDEAPEVDDDDPDDEAAEAETEGDQA